MASIGTIKVEVTPEIREAINHLVPVVRASEELFDCMRRFGGTLDGYAICEDYRDAWDQAMTAYKQRPRPEQSS